MNFSGRYLIKVILCIGTVEYLNNSLSIFSANDNTTDGTVRGTGEEASLGASGSSGAEWKNNYVCTHLRSPPDGVRGVSPPPRSTGAACAQGRLLPRASYGTVCCVVVCLGLRFCQQLRSRLRHFCCCFRPLPGSLSVNPRLILPLLGYPCAQPSICLLTQVQNRPHRNKLRDCILPPED